MDIFQGMLDNPNFGRMYRGSSVFQGAFDKLMGMSVDESVARFRGKLKFDFDENGGIQIRSDDLGHTYVPTAGESVSQFITRVRTGGSSGATGGFGDPTEGFGLGYVKTSEVITGRQLRSGRRELGDIAERLGVDIRFRTFDPDPGTLDRIYMNLGGIDNAANTRGLITGDTDKIRVVEMLNRRTGNMMTHDEIINALGINPTDANFGKRVRAMFNATQVSVGFDPGELNIGRIETERMLNADPLALQRATARASREAAFNPSVNVNQRISEIMNSETDGLNFQSRAANQRMMSRFADNARQMRVDYIRRHGNNIHSAAARGELREIEEFEAEIARLRNNITNGHAFNLRAFGGTSAGVGEYVKGDIMVMSDDQFRAIARRSNAAYTGLSDEELDKLDILAPESKSDIGIRADRAGRITMDPVGRWGHQANANVLSLANYGDMYNPEMPGGGTFLGQSLRGSLDEFVEGIKRGDVAGLKRIAEDLANISLDDFDGDLAAYQSALNRKQFNQRVLNFVASGNRLDLDPGMTAEALRIVREHHFHERRHGKTIRFGGEDVTDLSLRIAMPNTVEAHGVAGQIIDRAISDSVVERPGMTVIAPSADVSRFRFSDFDIDKAYDALGGPDLDDRFVASFVYDSKARRLMATVSRDPNALAEYAMFDAEVSRDTQFTKKILEIRGEQKSAYHWSIERKQINMKIEQIARKGEWSKLGQGDKQQVERLGRRLYDINEAIHRYYSTDAGLNQVDLAARYSLDARTQATGRRYAPQGFQTTEESLGLYRQGSIVRGYQRGPESVTEFYSTFRRELDLMRNDEAMLPFQYRGRGFSEVFTGPGGIGRSQLYVDAKDVYVDQFAAMERASRQPARQLTAEGLRSTNYAVAQANHLLGKTVNVATTIDQFIESTLTAGAFDADQIDQFRNLVEREGRIVRIARESAIDAIRKTGDASFIDVIEDVTNRNLTTVGRILAGMPGLGIDPALLGQRLQGDTLGQIARGYSSAAGREVDVDELRALISLSPDDPRSVVGGVFKEVFDIRDEFDTEAADIVRAANQNILSQLDAVGFEATAEETENARQLIDGFLADQRELINPLRNEQRLQEMIEDALNLNGDADVSQLMGEFSSEEVNMRTVRRLEQMGLLDDRLGLNNTLLAARQLAAEMDLESGRSLAAQALSQTSILNPNLSVGKLMNEAMAMSIVDVQSRESILEMARFSDDSTINERMGRIFTAARDLNWSGEYSRQHTFAEALDILRTTAAGGGEESILRGISRRIGAPAGASLEDILDMPDPRLSETLRAEPPGTQHFIRRSIADEISNEIPIAQNTMRRMDMSELSRLMSVPGFRKGLGAAAIFAGLGLIHELRGERSPDQMEGPPLLPGGSSYEEFQGFDPRSIHSTTQSPTFGQMGQGTTYRIRANGSFDPHDLGTQVQSLTGGSLSSTIYQGRRTVNHPASSSMEILNSRNG